MTQQFITCCIVVITLLNCLKIFGQQLSEPEKQEMFEMISNVNNFNGQSSLNNLQYRSVMIHKMLNEANYFADKLRLPTKRPMVLTDVQFPIILNPWFGIIREPLNHGYWPQNTFSNRIFDASIPRETRLRALEMGIKGTIETSNFFFSFDNGQLWELMRLSEHGVEYYSKSLEKLVGTQSLIDTNGAYQLATQWLAAVDVDMVALNKLKWTVNQLHYKALGTTNFVDLPLYYVDFGIEHYSARDNMHAFDEPLISVEILGTTKELQNLEIKDLSYSRRPLLIITNALDLIRTPNLPMKHFENSPASKTNTP